MLGWMKHKLKSRLPGEIISNLRYVADATLMAESKEELKSLLMKVKEEGAKVGLKLNIQTTTQLYSSNTSKVMFKSLQARLQQYVNRELPDVQDGFRKETQGYQKGKVWGSGSN